MILNATTTAFSRMALIAGLLMLSLCLPVHGAVKLPGTLGSGMVLQRNRPITIWGWAEPGEQVTVSFQGRSAATGASAEGGWSVTLPAMEEGGPHTMTILGENTITLDDVLIGDIWVCSGQSNPGMAWKACSPSTVGPFSAVGYFFGRSLQEKLGVPIGLVNASWGGSNIEAWTSRASLMTVPEIRKNLGDVTVLTGEEIRARNEKARNELCARFGLTSSKALKTDDWGSKNLDLTYWQPIEVPGAWEHRGLGDLDGIVWFRTEVTLPPQMCTKPVSLCLGKIDDADRTFVNGSLVGETQVYNTPREYVVQPGTFIPGRNVIAVRVEDTGGGGGFWSSPRELKLLAGSAEIPLAGTWKCRPTPEKLVMGESVRNPNATPSSLYNGMIHPLLRMPIRGVIWYQGESNVPRAFQYRTLFPLMITCWREAWKQPEMPFLFVQLANYLEADQVPAGSDWAELREAQAMTLRLPGTGMAVAIDIGDASDIHPRNKQEVGRRLALNALNRVYGMDIVSSGPVYDSMRIEGDRAIISFRASRSPLRVNDRYGYLKGFAIAGPDKKFHWAQARLEKNMVIVSSQYVKAPAAVRYAWGNNPDDANLYNEENLPASPFRTDNWPGVTSPGGSPGTGNKH